MDVPLKASGFVNHWWLPSTQSNVIRSFALSSFPGCHGFGQVSSKPGNPWIMRSICAGVIKKASGSDCWRCGLSSHHVVEAHIVRPIIPVSFELHPDASRIVVDCDTRSLGLFESDALGRYDIESDNRLGVLIVCQCYFDFRRFFLLGCSALFPMCCGALLSFS